MLFSKIFPQCLCVYTRQVEHQRCSRTDRVQKNKKIRKNTILMNTLLNIFCILPVPAYRAVLQIIIYTYMYVIFSQYAKLAYIYIFKPSYTDIHIYSSHTCIWKAALCTYNELPFIQYTYI